MRRWLLGTPLPPTLATEAREAVAFLRTDAPEADRAARAFDVIFAVGEHSLEHHFREPLDRLGVGRITQQAVGVALALALKSLRRPLRSVLDGLSDAQLRTVADEIEVRLYPDPHASG